MDFVKRIAKWLLYGFLAISACTTVLLVYYMFQVETSDTTSSSDTTVVNQVSAQTQTPGDTLTSPPTPTSRPTDTPVPTVTPDKEKAYKDAALDIADDYIDVSSEMSIQMTGVTTVNSLDAEELETLRATLAKYEELAQEVRQLEPPERWLDFHEQFLIIADDYEEMAQLLAEGFTNKDTDAINKSFRLLQRANARMKDIDRHKPEDQ